MQYPPPALFVPVNAAAKIPPAGQNKLLLRKSVQGKAVADGVQTPGNPYRKVAKGMERITQYVSICLNYFLQ